MRQYLSKQFIHVYGKPIDIDALEAFSELSEVFKMLMW